jgi:hypothetical protein
MFTATVNVKLTVPLKWESQEITSVNLDFGKINGKMLNQCEREASGNITAAMRPLSTEYTSRLASMISGIPFKAIEKFSYEDFELICAVVQRFLTKEDPQEYYNETMGFTIPAVPALPENPSMEDANDTRIL